VRGGKGKGRGKEKRKGREGIIMMHTFFTFCRAWGGRGEEGGKKRQRKRKEKKKGEGREGGESVYLLTNYTDKKGKCKRGEVEKRKKKKRKGKVLFSNQGFP